MTLIRFERHLYVCVAKTYECHRLVALIRFERISVTALSDDDEDDKDDKMVEMVTPIFL